MATRAWNVVCLVWGLVFLLNGMTKEGGVGAGDLVIGAAPLLVGVCGIAIARYVSGR